MNEILKKKEEILLETINSKDFKTKISKAIPNDMSVDRFIRISTFELQKNPKLLECTSESFISAIIQASQIGLELGDIFGQAYLVPRRKKGVRMVNLDIGYKGYIDLAYRNERVLMIDTEAVFTNDHFDYKKGTSQFLDFVATDKDDRGAPKYFYAIAHLRGGMALFRVLKKLEIDRIRSLSPAAKEIAWTLHYPEMGKKSTVRNICKIVPSSIALQQAIIIGGRAEAGIQNTGVEVKQMYDIDLPEDKYHEVENNDKEKEEVESKTDELTEKMEG